MALVVVIVIIIQGPQVYIKSGSAVQCYILPFLSRITERQSVSHSLCMEVINGAYSIDSLCDLFMTLISDWKSAVKGNGDQLGTICSHFLFFFFYFSLIFLVMGSE